MNTIIIRRTCASLALVAALALASPSVVLADPPAGKGNDKSAQQGTASQNGNSGQQGKSKAESNDGRYDDKNSNHGQVVSECNHRANDRNLKGQDRKEWTEWCEERGSRNNYDYRRYSSDRNCYQKADNKGLSGDKRRKFINDCLNVPNKY
jgi:hypothetical protein